jgi:hypothetical protein
VGNYLDNWARQLVRRGLRSGLIEGSNVWLSVGAIAWLFRFLSRRPSPQVNFEELRLGESLIVSHVPAPPHNRRARRKAARKADSQARRESKRQAKREASRRYVRAAAKAAKRHPPTETGKAGRSRRGEQSQVPSRSEGDGEEPT